jgi:hypothetical protein
MRNIVLISFHMYASPATQVRDVHIEIMDNTLEMRQVLLFALNCLCNGYTVRFENHRSVTPLGGQASSFSGSYSFSFLGVIVGVE